MGRELCLVSIDAFHSRIACDTRECLSPEQFHIRANELRDRGLNVQSLACSSSAMRQSHGDSGEHEACASQADCAASMVCLPTDTGGICELCRTFRDPDRSSCSFIPPERALTECVSRLGLEAPPASVRAAMSIAASHPRGAYDHELPGVEGGIATAVVDCMRALDRTQSGCCATEACVPLSSDMDGHAHVMGRCEPLE